MKKLDYLKKAILLELYKQKAWIVSVIATVKESEDAYKTNPYQGRIVKQSWGYSYVDIIDNEISLIKIEDADPNQPLFRFNDRLIVTQEMCPNITEPVESSFGTLLVNLITIVYAFGTKIPYINGAITVKAVENIVASRLKDTPEDPSKREPTAIYTDEYVKYVNALQFLVTLAQLSAVAATVKAITPPTGIKEFKANLLKKYEGKLNDPVMVSKFEAELMEFDDQYLRDDPSYGKIMQGKLKNQARRQMFLASGAEKGFGDTVKIKPIIESLDEGWPIKDPEDFTTLMSGLRAGSYARGVDTVKGGVSAKVLLRAANNFKIKSTDCGSKLGIRRVFTKKTIEQLVGRYIIVNGKTIFIENNTVAENYIDKPLVVRSPMYCKLTGDNICSVCAGNKLSQFPTGVSIALTEMSAIILMASMKAMHTNQLLTNKLKWKEALT